MNFYKIPNGKDWREVFLNGINTWLFHNNSSNKKTIDKKLSKFACFLEHRFWGDFGKALGGLGETKIFDFGCFCMCSCQHLSVCV